ncbi:MAG: sll0787 family AIR synthase-like protein [Acidocella sp.]|nr:sll0787 family AIR synthase-like protein [Acidocella sp.]
MSLPDLIAALRRGIGLTHKHDIAPVLAQLNPNANGTIAIGDDCAAIPDHDSFLLFAIEGFMPGFIAAEPHFAGYCGVMVNISDIAAMGGRPVAVVDAIWAQDAANAAPILAGLAEAARRYNIPIVGGHTNSRAATDCLAVAILGRAANLLTSFDARPGDNLLAAIDLRGAMRPSGPYWDASTTAPPDRLRADLDLLPQIAEAGLSIAAKDISMAGIIGTAIMLLEASGAGAVIDLAAIPCPPGMSLEQWLPAFPSFGFLLSVAPQNTPEVLAMFAARGIGCAVIGTVKPGPYLRLRLDDDEQTAWDISKDTLILKTPSLADA